MTFKCEYKVKAICEYKSEDDCFLAGKQWQIYTVCWKAETLLSWQRSIQSRLWSSQWSCKFSELDCKEGRMPKNWCLQTVVLEKTPGNPLDSKEIKPVNLKGDQSWIFTGRNDAEAEAPVFWPSDTNRPLTGKVPQGKKSFPHWERLRAEEECIREWDGWTASLCNEHELGQTPGDRGRRRPGVLQSMCGKESDMTKLLNNNNNKVKVLSDGR